MHHTNIPSRVVVDLNPSNQTEEQFEDKWDVEYGLKKHSVWKCLLETIYNHINDRNLEVDASKNSQLVVALQYKFGFPINPSTESPGLLQTLLELAKNKMIRSKTQYSKSGDAPQWFDEAYKTIFTYEINHPVGQSTAIIKLISTYPDYFDKDVLTKKNDLLTELKIFTIANLAKLICDYAYAYSKQTNFPVDRVKKHLCEVLCPAIATFYCEVIIPIREICGLESNISSYVDDKGKLLTVCQSVSKLLESKTWEMKPYITDSLPGNSSSASSVPSTKNEDLKIEPTPIVKVDIDSELDITSSSNESDSEVESDEKENQDNNKSDEEGESDKKENEKNVNIETAHSAEANTGIEVKSDQLDIIEPIVETNVVAEFQTINLSHKSDTENEQNGQESDLETVVNNKSNIDINLLKNEEEIPHIIIERDEQREVQTVIIGPDSPSIVEPIKRKSTDTIKAIEAYIENYDKRPRGFCSRLFRDNTRGKNRAKIYLYMLDKVENEQEDSSAKTLARYIITYALLASYDGETLQKYVTAALLPHKPLLLEVKKGDKESILEDLKSEIQSLNEHSVKSTDLDGCVKELVKFANSDLKIAKGNNVEKTADTLLNNIMNTCRGKGNKLPQNSSSTSNRKGS